MASISRITITVTSSRGASTVKISSNGRYISFPTRGYDRALTGEPIQPTSTLGAYWLSVLGIVLANITANPTPDD